MAGAHRTPHPEFRVDSPAISFIPSKQVFGAKQLIDLRPGCYNNAQIDKTWT